MKKPKPPPPPQTLATECEPVQCRDLRSKLEYCWQILHHHGLITTAEVERIQGAIGERGRREAV